MDGTVVPTTSGMRNPIIFSAAISDVINVSVSPTVYCQWAAPSHFMSHLSLPSHTSNPWTVNPWLLNPPILHITTSFKASSSLMLNITIMVRRLPAVWSGCFIIQPMGAHSSRCKYRADGLSGIIYNQPHLHTILGCPGQEGISSCQPRSSIFTPTSTHAHARAHNTDIYNWKEIQARKPEICFWKSVRQS